MTKYIPFLKFKQNELQALAALDQEIISGICPLFDIPRTSKIMTSQDVLKRLDLAKKQLSGSCKNISAIAFYLDNIDLNEDIHLDGVPQYQFILEYLKEYNLIPVIALNRTKEHNQAAFEFSAMHGTPIALRLQLEDLESFALVEDELSEIGDNITEIGADLHVLMDFRVIQADSSAASAAKAFIAKFQSMFAASLYASSGSIIPSNITKLIATGMSIETLRLEVTLWQELRKIIGLQDLVFGDYGVVSPDYSDADLDPRILRQVSTPKAFYAHDGQVLVIRGISFEKSPLGNGQYFDIADTISSKIYFRNKDYSFGDEYIFLRGHSSPIKPAKAGTPGSWVKATLACHVTYVVRTI